MNSEWFMITFLTFVFITATVGETGTLVIDRKKRTIWYSEPFDHECLLECAHGLDHTQFEDVSIINRNCSVQCSSDATEHHQYGREKYKRVQVMNPNTGAQSECLVGVLREDIFCATVSIKSGVRQWNIDNTKQCRRKNFRYYLPHHTCDDIPHVEVGEESCTEACVPDGSVRGQRYITLDADSQRAKFHVCHGGMVTEPNRSGNQGRFWHFCRAEMTPCSSCFRWGSWTAVTLCSSTCGPRGVVTFLRSCEVKDRIGIYRQPTTYRKISNGYCKAYFGGTEAKTESCQPNTPCPGWAQWGPWVGCPNDDMKSSNTVGSETKNYGQKKTKCKTSRRKRAVTNSEDVQVISTAFLTSNVTTPAPTPQSSSNASIAAQEKLPLTLRGKRAYRTRRCWQLRGHICEGNSTEFRSCDDDFRTTAQPEENTEFDDECVEDDQNITIAEKSSTDAVTVQSSNINVTTRHYVNGQVTDKETTESSSTTLKSKILFENNNRRNRNFTLDDDGFTSVINNYAPALIAGLLIFIVLLLIALIAICGTRIMQKNRRTRYDITSPSFSAGTMGSIPSGLVQGFTHVLGLRRGSGTFGRSASTINGVGHISDALSSRGSCKSVSSATSGHATKRKSTQLTISPSQIAAINGIDHTGNSILQNSPRAQIPMTDLSVKSKLTSREVSTSSLISGQAFHPLPPIPSQCPTGNDNLVFKRGAGRSSSLNPTVNDKSSMHGNFQPRAESVSGYVTGLSHDRKGSPWNKGGKFAGAATTRKGKVPISSDASVDAYCVHDCTASTCSNKSKEKCDASLTENEYWSVTRDGCFDATMESRIRTKSTNQGRMKPLRSAQAENSRDVIRMARLRSQPPLGENDEEPENEMVDNVLYAGIKNLSGKNTDDSKLQNSSKYEKSVIAVREKQFYNSVDPDDSHDNELETSASTEDDYDHLCDQFGGSFTKGREKHSGTMASLRQLRHHSSEELIESNTAANPHDYECIEFDSESGENTTGGARSTKDASNKKRAESNEYVITS